LTKATYLYHVNYQEFDEPLWALDSRMLFKNSFDAKIFESNKSIAPSMSAFIKSRLMIRYRETSFEALIQSLKENDDLNNSLQIKYLKLKSGDPHAQNRKALYKRIVEVLKEADEMVETSATYGLTYYEGQWLFGPLESNDGKWRDHSKRPHTYSNSLKGHLAKVLINAAGQGDLSKRLIDPLCGAGTVLLEACYLGYVIEGSDINEKMTRSALENLHHFAYEAQVKPRPIEAIDKHYDAAIIDLPYGLYSQTTAEKQKDIIKQAKRIADRVVIVSSEEIAQMINSVGLDIIDRCKVLKTKNKSFARYIWVCE